jgi:hypothetical protein
MLGGGVEHRARRGLATGRGGAWSLTAPGSAADRWGPFLLFNLLIFLALTPLGLRRLGMPPRSVRRRAGGPHGAGPSGKTRRHDDMVEPLG